MKVDRNSLGCASGKSSPHNQDAVLVIGRCEFIEISSDLITPLMLNSAEVGDHGYIERSAWSCGQFT